MKSATPKFESPSSTQSLTAVCGVPLLLFLMAGCACGAQSAREERVEVRPVDTGAALENPGMGWVFHFYDNWTDIYGSRLAAADTVDDFPGLTVIYMRLPWAFIEPEEGRFN